MCIVLLMVCFVLLGFEIYSSAIPPKGTPVTLVIQAATDQEIKEIAHYEEELEELAQLKRRETLERDKLRPLPPPPPQTPSQHPTPPSPAQPTYRVLIFDISGLDLPGARGGF